MKRTILLFIISLSLLQLSCKKVLEEDVRSQISDGYLNTPTGWQEGVNGCYNSLRSWYGQTNPGWLTVFGTDEYTYGASEIGFDTYNNDINPTSAVILGPWNSMYSAINACNAVINRAPDIDLDSTLKKARLGEALFLRAHAYFILVQLYGPVYITLQQTSGTSRIATRSPIDSIYNVIIDDLTTAVADLPQTSPDWGRITLPAAKHLLAKVYLTRAGGPAKQTGDYAKAAQLATEVISTPGPQLLPDFASIFVQGPGEKNAEVLLSAQYSTEPLTNTGGQRSHMLFLADYTSQSGMVRDLANGRPFAHFRPTDWMTTLYNKTYDARFDKTFRTVWLCNKAGTYAINKDIVPNKTVAMKLRDTAFVIGDREYTDAERNAKNYTLIPKSKIVRNVNGGGNYGSVYPTNLKFYDSLRTDVNSQEGTRDFIIFRLAETYLIAAEAYIMDGKPDLALPYVNAIRRRAAKTGATAAITAANQTAMEVTLAQMTLDFILDERARELSGEYMRWFDLVRTNKLLERVKLYNPSAAAGIKPYHVLRPIPQQQIDRTEGGATAFPQNEGYQ